MQKIHEIEGDRIRQWKGYRTEGREYTICQQSMPLNFKNLEQRLFEELNQLRKLEPGVELALRSL